MSDVVETVEVREPVAEPVVVESPKPGREELKKAGWTATELDAAEKRGMIEKAEPKTVESKEGAKPTGPEVKEEPKAEEKAEEKPSPRVSSIPDFTFKTPEQEKVWLEAFGPGTPQRAMYFRMKNERTARQKIADELAEARAELDRMKQDKPAGKVDELGFPVDGESNEGDQPLTVGKWKELQERERQDRIKEEQEFSKKVAVLREAQLSQEEFAREVYPDFDDAVIKAKEVIQNVEGIIPEKWKQAKVIRLIGDLQRAAREADKLGVEDYNAAHIAYEIAQFHPGHGAKTEAKANGTKPENGAKSPDVMKRIEQNAQRRTSSASVAAGGGNRSISVDDVGAVEVSRMTPSERWRFREKHPERYESILRG